MTCVMNEYSGLDNNWPIFSPYSCNKLHMQRQQAKVVFNVLLILLCCSHKIESLRSFPQHFVCFVCLLLNGTSALFKLSAKNS